jgi:hypothetical protein
LIIPGFEHDENTRAAAMAAEAATPKHGEEVGCGTAGAEGRDCRCMDEMGAYVQENVQEG